jgi:aspartyl-tRNA(Asn)/glutamyl-tRNA(Gln) amidotransferase subunit A
MLGEEVLYLPVSELSHQIRSGELSPVALTESYLERLERLGPKLGAVATATGELGLEQARQAEQELSRGHYRGPLHGVPYGVKDLCATRGIPTTWGAPPYKDQVFDYDSTVVRRLSQAGAVLIAKLAMIELAGGGGYSSGKASLTGPTLNPWDTTRWAGGSSSGPGAATAAALVGFSIGSETWGSILTPSSFCNVTGLRPTYGRVSRAGAMALAWTMDKLGPMCRSAADCGLVLAAIAGHDSKDPTSIAAPFSFQPGSSSLEGVRVGWLQEDFEKHGEPEVEPLYQGALELLRQLGAEVTETKLPNYPHGAIAGMIISAEGSTAFEKLIRTGQVDQLVDEQQRNSLKRALDTTAADYLKAMRIRRLIQEAVAQLFESFDLLVAPSLLFVASPIEKNLNEVFRGSAGLGAVGNLCGLPGLSVPMGFGAGQLPVGLALVGRPFDEATVLRVGCAYQQVTDWHTRRPPIS